MRIWVLHVYTKIKINRKTKKQNNAAIESKYVIFV